MSTIGGRNAASQPVKVPARPRPFPFWVLQVTELIVALVFVDLSVHVSGGSLLVVAAVLFAVLAVTAAGPLGLLRICPPQLHIAIVVAAAVLLAAAPVVPALRPDIEGIIVLEFGVVGLIRVATLTRTPDQPARRVGTRRGAQRVIETTASVVDPGTARRPPEPAAPAAEGAAHRAGRTAGTAAASGKRLVAKHRPAAETRLKESIRSAGRWAGRMASPPSDHEPGGR